jgi:hypothetical protein
VSVNSLKYISSCVSHWISVGSIPHILLSELRILWGPPPKVSGRVIPCQTYSYEIIIEANELLPETGVGPKLAR